MYAWYGYQLFSNYSIWAEWHKPGVPCKYCSEKTEVRGRIFIIEIKDLTEFGKEQGELNKYYKLETKLCYTVGKDGAFGAATAAEAPGSCQIRILCIFLPSAFGAIPESWT